MVTGVFWFFAAVAVISALLCILQRSPVSAALWLVSTMFSLAAIYVLLDAQFIAAIQVLIYAGAVMVLFLFVIMLLNLREEELGPRRFTLMKLFGVFGSLYAGFLLVAPMMAAGKPMTTTNPNFGTVEGVGLVVFRDYLLPFELTSILLLAAVVGAVVLAKRKV